MSEQDRLADAEADLTVLEKENADLRRQLAESAELHLADESTIYQLQQGTAVKVLTERLAEAQAERDRFAIVVGEVSATARDYMDKYIAAEAELTTLRALVTEAKTGLGGWDDWLARAGEELKAASQ